MTLSIGHERLRATVLSTSALPYLTALILTLVGSRYAQYLSSGVPWVKGQPAGVVLSFAGFAVVVLLWLLLNRRARPTVLASWFLATAAVSWVIHAVLLRVHGDASLYTVWLVLPILGMLWLKPPDARELLGALRVLGWAWVIVLIGTRLLEIAGVIDVFYQAPGIVAFDKANYWLPFSGTLGIDGRWPGPFSHPGDTGAIAAFLIVIAAIVKRRSGWVFAVVGVFVLILAGTRVGYVAAAAGLGLMLLFGQSKIVGRVPRWVRLTAVALGLVVVTGVMVRRSTSLSGRSSNIWPAFLDLWKQDPALGVGGSGIAANGGVTERFVHGHNLVIDELARNGLVGLAIGAVVLVLVGVIVVRSLLRGVPGPTALVATYLVIGVTQAMNDWVNPSLPWLIIVVSVLLAESSRGESAGTLSENSPSEARPSA